MTIQIKKLKPSDLAGFSALIRVFEDVFEMEGFVMPPDKHLRDLLADDQFMVFVALDENDSVVAGLTAYTLVQYYSVKPLAYVYDLAVDRALQRQGIGKLLMQAITAHCREKGYEEVFVQADKADDYALDFYHTTRPSNYEEVVHFYYRLGEVPPVGRDDGRSEV